MADRITSSQAHALGYVARYEDADFGVIIHYTIGEALIKRGYCLSAKRRRYSRETGCCVRLTDKGKAWVDA